MLTNVVFGVRDMKRATSFYDAAFGALGYKRVSTGEKFTGYGPAEKANFFICMPRNGVGYGGGRQVPSGSLGRGRHLRRPSGLPPTREEDLVRRLCARPGRQQDHGRLQQSEVDDSSCGRLSHAGRGSSWSC